MNLKLSKTAIRELTKRYRAVLLAAVAAGAFVATGANAADTWSGAITETNAFMDDLATNHGWDKVNGNVTGYGVSSILTAMSGAATATDAAITLVNDSTKGNEALYTAISGKQDTLTTAQQNAVDSGITSALVGKISANETNIGTINTNIGLINTQLTNIYTKTETDSAISTAIGAATTGMLTTSNYATTLDSVYAKTADLPTKTSDLTNDSGFITKDVADLTNYTTTTDMNTALAGKVDKTTTVNGHALSSNVTLDATDVLTATQQSAVNSGITGTLVTQIGTNQTNIAANAAEITKLTTGTDTGTLNVLAANIGATGLSSAGDIKTTGSGNIVSAGNISTTNGTISGKTGSFSGDLGVTGTTTTGTLAVTNNATVGGTLGVTGAATVGSLNAGSGTITTTGAISGATGTFTGALTSVGLDAGSGDITTTGGLSAGAASVSSLTSSGAISGTTGTFSGKLTSAGLDAGSSKIQTTGSLEAGDLKVIGASTLKGVATLEQGFKFSTGATITSADDGSAALTGGNATTLATTATVLKSAENATYTGTKVTGDSASTTLNGALNKTVLALNNVLTTAGTEVDSAKVDVQWNSTDSTLATVLGNGVYSSENQITKGDSMTVALGKLDAAVGNTTFSGKNAASAADLTAAVNAVDTAIGDRSTLSATNGNLTASSDIVTALNALDGTLGNIKALDGTDGTGPTGNLAASGKTVADHLNAIDARIGQINGLVANANDTTTSTGVNYYGNLAVGTTIEDHLEALDAAIGDRRNDYTNEYTITKGETVTASLDALDTVIGDIAGMTNAGGNLGADVATSLDGLDAAIGDRNYTSTKYVTAGDNLTTAVSTLDQNIEKVENKVDNLGNRVNKMEHKMKSGFASLAAMSALVPNARVAGDTQISVGTGYYRGTTGFALGAFHHINDNVLLNAGASYAGNGAAVFKGGVTFGF